MLRISLGWLLFYAGIIKIINPAWSAAGYLQGAKTFGGFYRALLDPAVLPTVNILNEWGLTLLGLAILLGIFVRVSSFLGALLMLLYYFPILVFPHIPPHSYIVDEHIIYIVAFLVLASFRAGNVWGLAKWCMRLPICQRFPVIRSWLE